MGSGQFNPCALFILYSFRRTFVQARRHKSKTRFEPLSRRRMGGCEKVSIA